MTTNQINVAALTLADVKQAYSGKNGHCCCGCAGTHYHAKAMGDYRGGGTNNDLRQIKRIFNLITLCDPCELETVSDAFVSRVIDGRLYIIYSDAEANVPEMIS